MEVFIVSPQEERSSQIQNHLNSIGLNSVRHCSELSQVLENLKENFDFAGLIIFVVENYDFSFAESIKKIRDQHPNCPILSVLYNPNIENLRLLVQAGVDEVLLRDFSTDDLMEKISSAQVFRYTILDQNQKQSNSSEFKCHVDKSGAGLLKINIEGRIEEYCELPKINSNALQTTILFETEKLSAINSIGIRLWLIWFRALRDAGYNRFEFENLKPAILVNALYIKSFFPSGTVINSFYLPFVDEDDGHEIFIKFRNEYRINGRKTIIPNSFNFILENKNKTFKVDASYFKALNLCSVPYLIV